MFNMKQFLTFSVIVDRLCTLNVHNSMPRVAVSLSKINLSIVEKKVLKNHLTPFKQKRE